MRPAAVLALAGLSAGGALRCSKHGAATSSPPPAAGPVLPVGPIGHQGRWLIDAEGRVVLLHGVNVVNKAPPYTPAAEAFSDEHAAWLAANGFLLVRVGVLATGLLPAPGAVDAGYVQQIVATVSMLASHGIFSLIDLHQDGWGPVTGSDGFPAWMTLTGDAGNDTEAGFPFYYQDNPALQQAFQSFWGDATGPGDAGLQSDYASMFGALAAALASQPYVLGYDLFNEPWPGTTWSACLNDPDGCPALDQSELGPAYAKAVAAIRAAGDQHLVLGEPFVLFNYGTSTTSLPLPGGDPGAGMSFHVYPLSPNQAPDVIANAVAWSADAGGAILNTEWGASTSPLTLGPESKALDEAFVPWIFWSFCCELVDAFDAGPDAGVVASTADVLVHAFPLAVAGTPQSLSLDTTAETLSFAWSTSPVSGAASFPAGTPTAIEVPARAYPQGYEATVTGGWVTSAPCASLLTVEAMPGTETVTVDVAPGGTCP
ncbi:MAG TPA: cellulase family glycosylhydrolase [Polyangiaceae bacterium]